MQGGCDGVRSESLDPDRFKGVGVTGDDTELSRVKIQQAGKKFENRIVGPALFRRCRDGNPGTPLPLAEQFGSSGSGYNLHWQQNRPFGFR